VKAFKKLTFSKKCMGMAQNFQGKLVPPAAFGKSPICKPAANLNFFSNFMAFEMFVGVVRFRWFARILYCNYIFSRFSRFAN
jgi:hypothetical protein